MALAEAASRASAADAEPRGTEGVVRRHRLQLALDRGRRRVIRARLADWAGTPVYLASHFQARSGADGSLIVTRPLERFAAHAELRVRDTRARRRRPRARHAQLLGNRRRDLAVDIHATRRRCPRARVVPIDFSIDDGSFGYVSFIDVVNGRVDPAALRGKTVYVGPTAIELGDIVTVPVYRALPGVVVQAFATESVRDGPAARAARRVLRRGVSRFWTLCCALLFGRRGWRPNAALRRGRLRRARGRHVGALRRRPSGTRYRAVRARARRDCSSRPRFARSTSRRGGRSRPRSESSGATRCCAASSTPRPTRIVCIDEQGTIRTANPATSRICSAAFMRRCSTPSSPEFIPGLAGDIDLGLASLAGTPLERTAQ